MFQKQSETTWLQLGLDNRNAKQQNTMYKINKQHCQWNNKTVKM